MSSSLWHRLACLEPPAGLLQQLQSVLVNFFWNRFHWVSRGTLYLLKEEGGQGLVHLASRVATFRLQFLQKLLTGSCDVVWRPLASCILKTVNRLGLDYPLFLMNTDCFNLHNLSTFYQSLFKTWSLFTWERPDPTLSLHWLLEEPLIFGARLDLQDEALPGLTHKLTSAGITTLRKIVEAAGPGMENAAVAASTLGVRSVRVVERILELWRLRLTEEEQEMLQDYGSGMETPDEDDPFPDLRLSTDCGGVLDFCTAQRKGFYCSCVKALNASQLSNKTDTRWRQWLGVEDSIKPVWRVPSLKRLETCSGESSTTPWL